MKRAILLPPDAYSVWALIPDILLSYDTIIVDEQDFSEWQYKSARSSYDHLVAVALRQYQEHGLLEVRNLREYGDSSHLRMYNALVDDVLAELPEKVLQQGLLMFEHWESLCNTKMMFCTSDEPAFRNIGADKAKALCIIDSIKRDGHPPNDSDFDRIVKMCLLKALVSIDVAEALDVAFHDLPTLKPAIELLDTYFAERSSYKLPRPEDGASVLDSLVACLYRMASPGVVYDSPSCIRHVLALREDFISYRKALKALDSLYRDVRRVAIDDDTTKAKLENELLRIKELVDVELQKLKRRYRAISFPIDILSSLYVPGLSSAIQAFECKLEKGGLLSRIRKRKPTYEWFFAFQNLLARPAKLSRKQDSWSPEIEHSSWCSGTLPWYFIREEQ
jgi:hypothetical protein